MSGNDNDSDREQEHKVQIGWVHLGLRQLTANLLRVISGAGRPQDITCHLRALAEFIESYERAVGRYPRAREISSCLRISYDEQFVSQFDNAERTRIHAVETILLGSLRIAASRLLEQKTQETAAESKLYEGIREMDRAQELFRKERS